MSDEYEIAQNVIKRPIPRAPNSEKTENLVPIVNVEQGRKLPELKPTPEPTNVVNAAKNLSREHV